ncbi:MAG: XdhC family protein [Candidatus Aminicenantes bacterium]|nr:XdhC family protein [Candidatus Aminicenantes bacterium]MCJ7485535.1 XdhC family protein [Candidatus Aminicenantes bacterium]
MTYSLPKLIEILAVGKGLALATIVEAEGSTPQVTGASAVFSAAGLVAGTVGGGLLEARVESIAGQALRDGKARLATIRLDADPADMEGAICGGAARVLIDPGVGRERAVFELALDGFRKRRHGYFVAGIHPVEGDVVIVERVWLPIDAPWDPEKRGLAGVVLGIDDMEAASWPCLVKDEGRLAFIELVRPLPRLIIAGAGHVGRALARLGSLLDFSVTVIDDRPEFANAQNVPEADEIIVGDIGDSVRDIEDSQDNYFVIVTRGHRKDAEALQAAIRRPSAYLGMIGSKRKIEIMHGEFLESGRAAAAEWDKVHAPIGIEIGSKTVEEIAVSIAAELVLVRSKRKESGRP